MGNDTHANAFDQKWDTSEYLSLPPTGYRNEVVESCAQVAEWHSSARFGHDDPIAVKFWHLGEAYAKAEIAKAIRELKTK